MAIGARRASPIVRPPCFARCDLLISRLNRSTSGKRMPVRLATRDDSHAVAEIYAPVVQHTPISFELVPPTADEMAQRMSVVLKGHPWLIAEDAGRVSGFAYASAYAERAAYKWSATTTIYVRDGVRGKGVGRSLYRVLLRMLSAQNFRRAFAGITIPNAGSIGLHEAMGFRHVGTFPEAGFKLGRWHDVGWWSLPLSTRDGEPALPLTLDALGDLNRFME
jgi:phosphinothricin acetyltransferase